MQKVNSVAVRVLVPLSLVAAGLVTFIGTAGATTYDPTTDATNIADSTGSLAGPVIAAVFLGAVGVMVLFWVVGWIRGLLHRRGS